MHDDFETVAVPSGDRELYGRLRHHTDGTPTIVLLSGLGFHTFEYEPLATELAAARINSLSFDYRGHGRSPGPRGRWTLEELVADCRQAIDFAGRRDSGPIALFGNSLGALVGISAGIRDDRPLGVAAANCPARLGDFLLTKPRRALYALARLIEPVAPLRISANHFYSYEQLISDPAWVSTIRRDPLIGDARRLSARTYRELLEVWDGPEAVRELHKPLLLIQGRNDHMQPRRQTELVCEAAHEPKRYELVDTGHLPHLEAPGTVSALLTKWLSEIERRS